MSWKDAAQQLARLGLALPTEAQWEYAARAGTESPWWTGVDAGSLAGAANVKDQAWDRGGGRDSAEIEDFDDGWVLHAPVDTYRANDFGLHNVHGNAWEWCQDSNDTFFYTPGPSRDPVNDTPDAGIRVYRGGGFGLPADAARSALRFRDAPGDRLIGVRPARAVDP